MNRIGKKVLLNQTPTNKKKALIVGDGIGCLMGCPGPAARLKEGNRASLRVARLGNSSVRYEIGLFRNDEEDAVAQGHFIHVYVERSTRRPATLPPEMRKALELILVQEC